MSVLLLRHEPEDAAESPELRYLASFCIAEARKVFGSVEDVPWRAGMAISMEELTARASPILVFGSAGIHLGARSLEAMKGALDAGAGAVAPAELSTFDLDEPIHTLRAFELAETRILAGEPEAAARSSHLPVTLFSASYVAGRLGDVSAEAMLRKSDLLALRGLTSDLTCGGVYHEFIDYYGEVREDILPYLPEEATDILEVGCGRGHTGALIQERLGCRVTGVELNPGVAREAAERLHHVIVGDILQVDVGQRFDAVVATELFEHLDYPETFLAKMKPLLRPGGRIVMSVPNVGHHAVVEDLLAGRWDYLPIGLLCYTHFRFFTRATLASWIERAGFASYRIVAQTGELPERFNALPEVFEIDRESLRTTGFYVVVEVEPA